MEGGNGARWTDEELIDDFEGKLVSELERLANKSPSTGSGQGKPFSSTRPLNLILDLVE